jgi:outer membrane lipoprotein-sorting protein
MKSRRILWTAGFLFSLAGRLLAQDAQTILARVDSVMNAPKDMVALEKMTLIDKGGSEKARDMKLYQKGSQWRLVRFLTPADVRGVSFLRLAEDRMYLYLPAFRKVRRIASSIKNEDFMGTDFSYEDMSQTEFTPDYEAKLAAGDSEELYVLELTPKPKADVSYSKLVLSVRKDNFVYTKVEYYNKSGKLEKVLTVENIEKIGPYWVGKRMEMTNRRKNHRTLLILSEIQFDQNLKDAVFTERNLKRIE